MAIRANITLTDAATTPVNRVYYPLSQNGTVLNWVDRTTAVALGQNRLSVAQRAADKNQPTNKVSWKLETPVLAEASGATSSGFVPEPKVSHTLIGTVELVLPAKSTEQERKDLLAQMRDLIDEAIVTNQVEDYDFIW